MHRSTDPRPFTENTAMSEHDYFHESNPVVRLRMWALGHMMWGAFLAGLGLLAVGVFLLAVWWLGQFLPERSKQAPSPYGALQISVPAVG